MNPLVIILPLFLAQYLLAIVALTRLALCRLPMRKYLVWNLVILLAFFVGSIAFFGYYYGRRKKEAQALDAAEKTDAPPEAHEADGNGDVPPEG